MTKTGFTLSVNQINILTSLLAFVLSIVAGGLVVLVVGVNPIDTYAALFKGAWGNSMAIAGTINRMIPIIFTGLAIAIGQKGSVFNIGVDGQLMFGAFVAAFVGANITMPAFIHLPFTILVGALAGMLWAFIPALLRLKKNVSVVFSTIMFNHIAKYLVIFLMYQIATTDTAMNATAKILPTAMLPNMFNRNFLVNSGSLIALAAVFIVYIFISKTRTGYEMRAVGINPSAAGSAGINVKFHAFLALLLSGLLAGFAGAVEICGTSFRMFDNYNPGHMASGIAVAMLARGNPFAILLTAFLFASMRNGAPLMQVTVGVSAQFVYVVQGMIIIFMCSENLIRWIINNRKSAKRGVTNA